MTWTGVPETRVTDQIVRQVVAGERVMIARLEMAPHTITPIHSHPHEQITIVEQGRVRFSVDGVERILSAGDVLHLPSSVPHGATMLDEPVVLIDVFSPIREDFLPAR